MLVGVSPPLGKAEWAAADTGGTGERSKVADRPGAKLKLERGEAADSPGREIDGGLLFDFRKILPNIFLAPVGCGPGPGELGGCEKEDADMAVSGLREVGAGAGEIRPNSLSLFEIELPLPPPCPPSTLVRALGAKVTGAPPHISTGSKTARPMISNPRFWNLATLASVPASTTVFVMTLWACRLYNGMIIRRPDVLEDENDCMDALEEYIDPSVDLLEVVRESSAPSSSWVPADGGAEDRSRDCLLFEFLSPLLAGGTSCT